MVVPVIDSLPEFIVIAAISQGGLCPIERTHLFVLKSDFL